jgi:hypothetical protein
MSLDQAWSGGPWHSTDPAKLALWCTQNLFESNRFKLNLYHAKKLLEKAVKQH